MTDNGDYKKAKKINPELVEAGEIIMVKTLDLTLAKIVTELKKVTSPCELYELIEELEGDQ